MGLTAHSSWKFNVPHNHVPGIRDNSLNGQLDLANRMIFPMPDLEAVFLHLTGKALRDL
mgnify:CR=1 FL=1